MSSNPKGVYMIKLTNRQTNIIETLLDQTRPLPIESLSKQLNVSERTIRYDLKDIDYWMKLKGLTFIRKPRVGIWVDLKDKDRNSIKEELNIIEPYEYVLTMRERQDIITLLILLSDSYVSSQYIADELEISRNTVINDLKNIKVQLKKNNLELKSKPRFGFYAAGTEFYIRKLINNLVLIYIHESKFFETGFDVNKNDVGIALKLIYNSCRNIKIWDIKNAVKECKNIYDFWIPDNSYTVLLTDLMITIKRIREGKHIEFSKARINTMKKLQEYRVAKVIGEYLSKIYNVDFNEDELVYISYSLFNNDFKLKNFNDNIDEKEECALKHAIAKMIETAEKHVYLSCEAKEKLRQDLIAHLSLTLKKLSINAKNKNILLGEIKQAYSEEFVIAGDMLKSFSSIMNVDLDEDEIGYITIILAAQLEGQKTNKARKALIVCSTGKGSAKILLQRIKNTIPELEILGTFSAFELEDYPEKLKEADVVISTVYLKTGDKPLIKVSPFVSGSDISKIKSFIYEGKRNVYNREAEQEEYVLQALIEVVEKYVDKGKMEKAIQELSNTLSYLFKDTIHFSNKIEIDENYAEKTAMTIIEMSEMLNKLYEKAIIDQKDKNLFPIAIHIIMAIPRWKCGDYADEVDIEKYKYQNSDMFIIISEHLAYISKKYNLNVPETEVVSLMRYLL